MDEIEASEKVKEIIKKVSKLDWVKQIDGKPFMHLADVEKSMMGLLEESYMGRINEWVEDAEKKGA